MDAKILCPICKGKGELVLKDGRDFMVLGGKSDPFQIYFCQSCRIAYSTPHMTDSELMQYYPDEYEAYNPKKSIMAYLQRLKYKGDLKKILPHILTSGANMLEIGAGRGEFLKEARDAGFSVSGAEPGVAGRKFAKEQFDIALTDEFVADINFKETYDVIVMRYVLEHVNDPYGALKKILDDGLKQGGLLYLKLPRFDSWEVKLFKRYSDLIDLPRHRIHFTRDGIDSLLTGLGYKDVSVRAEIVPTSLLRAISYLGNFGGHCLSSALARIFMKLPKAVQLLVCQGIGYLLYPFGDGRMIILARK